MSILDVFAAIEGVGDPRGFAVIGAVARNAWAPPRATTDLDLTIATRPPLLATVMTRLEGLGYRVVRQQQADPADDLPDIVILRSDHAEPHQVDLLLGKTPFEEEVLRRAIPTTVESRTVPVATPEDLIVYKTLADRPRDREDVRAILRTQERAGRPIDWTYVERWAAFWGIGDRLARLRLTSS